ncbi:DUF1015 domain-containing protein [Haloechinothrix sp. YIM 98757]|uniref:DUF1015 domain-containing protein n=1 Tax=Haloechinothrix aidingensis TaxID=2752311 RepID=A0A838A8X0_9PSEU|nr:DUF1015 family protein [Haloechinothrix aidingensis]MBA0125888.1 DUF1015 domain-containing protein [Haloechinothrix aidingensis]
MTELQTRAARPATDTGLLRRPSVRVLAPNGCGTGALDQAQRDHAALTRLLSDGASLQHVEHSYIVYQLASAGRTLTGVVAEISVDAYRQGRIRPHEDTSPERERELATSLRELGAAFVPVTLMFDAPPALRARLAETATAPPDTHTTSADGVVQRAWRVTDPDLELALHSELAALSTLHIADGHHRMGAAARHARRAELGGQPTASRFVLAALFPYEDMHVLGYHRCVALPDAVPATDFLHAIRTSPGCARLSECDRDAAVHTAPGVVGVYLDGSWYRLELRRRTGNSDPRSSLDIVALTERVLAPVLGVGNVSADPRVTPVSGTAGAEGIATRCAENNEIGFILHPPTAEQVMAVADDGMVMPPKSTWFEPKARSGLFVHLLD